MRLATVFEDRARRPDVYRPYRAREPTRYVVINRPRLIAPSEVPNETTDDDASRLLLRRPDRVRTRTDGHENVEYAAREQRGGPVSPRVRS